MLEAFIRNGLIADADTRARLAAAIFLALKEGRGETGQADKGTEHVLPAIHCVLSHTQVQAKVRQQPSLSPLAGGLLLGFIRDSQQQLNELGHPHQAEQKLWSGFDSSSGNWFPENWHDIESLLDRIYRKEEIDPRFFGEMHRKLLARENAEGERKALRNMLLRDWGSLIDQKRRAYQTGKVDSWRDAFIKMLLQYLESWKKVAEYLDWIKRMLGPLWDQELEDCLSACTMEGKCTLEEILSALLSQCQEGAPSLSKKLLAELLSKQLALLRNQKQCDDQWGDEEGFWRPRHLEFLMHYETQLQNDPGLKKLAEMIGRGTGKGREKENTTDGQQLLPSGDHSPSAQKGAITGSRESGDLFSLFPSELALLSDPDTESVFLKKMAEQRLQTHEYQAILLDERNQSAPGRVQEGEADEKGPIIVCIDTSGSMGGERETYAKAVTYGLVKVALEQGRSCRIIAFSQGIQPMEVNQSTPLQEFLDFLVHSFHGGTDPTEALLATLHFMKEPIYRWADMLMVSDFQMGRLRPLVPRLMEDARKRGNRFYALLTGDQPAPGVLGHFDQVWQQDFRIPTRPLVSSTPSGCTQRPF